MTTFASQTNVRLQRRQALRQRGLTSRVSGQGRLYWRPPSIPARPLPAPFRHLLKRVMQYGGITVGILAGCMVGYLLSTVIPSEAQHDWIISFLTGLSIVMWIFGMLGYLLTKIDCHFAVLVSPFIPYFLAMGLTAILVTLLAPLFLTAGGIGLP